MTDVGARLWNGCQRGSPEHTVQPGAPPAESPLRAAYTSPPPTLFLGGEIDESTHRDLRRVVKLAIAARGHVLRVDMADVMYCDWLGCARWSCWPTRADPARPALISLPASICRDSWKPS